MYYVLRSYVYIINPVYIFNTWYASTWIEEYNICFAAFFPEGNLSLAIVEDVGNYDLKNEPIISWITDDWDFENSSERADCNRL